MKIGEEKIKKNALPGFIDLLGGRQVIDKFISSDFDLITLCNEGLPKASVDVLSTYMGISSKDFFKKILEGPANAFGHKTNPESFDRRTSSYVIEIDFRCRDLHQNMGRADGTRFRAILPRIKIRGYKMLRADGPLKKVVGEIAEALKY